MLPEDVSFARRKHLKNDAGRTGRRDQVESINRLRSQSQVRLCFFSSDGRSPAVRQEISAYRLTTCFPQSASRKPKTTSKMDQNRSDLSCTCQLRLFATFAPGLALVYLDSAAVSFSYSMRLFSRCTKANTEWTNLDELGRDLASAQSLSIPYPFHIHDILADTGIRGIRFRDNTWHYGRCMLHWMGWGKRGDAVSAVDTVDIQWEDAKKMYRNVFPKFRERIERESKGGKRDVGKDVWDILGIREKERK